MGFFTISSEREKLIKGIRIAKSEVLASSSTIEYSRGIERRRLPSGVIMITKNGKSYFLARDERSGMIAILGENDTGNGIHFEASGVGTIDLMKGQNILGGEVEEVVTNMVDSRGESILSIEFDRPDLTIEKILTQKVDESRSYEERRKAQKALELYGKIEELLGLKLKPDGDDELKLELIDEVKPKQEELENEEDLDFGIE